MFLEELVFAVDEIFSQQFLEKFLVDTLNYFVRLNCFADVNCFTYTAE